MTIFYVLLTVYLGMALVNNQIDAQFCMYIYFLLSFGAECFVFQVAIQKFKDQDI